MRHLKAAVSPLWRSYATQTMGRPVTKVPIPGVDHIVAVASGKGGVGKSTTAGECDHCCACTRRSVANDVTSVAKRLCRLQST